MLQNIRHIALIKHFKSKYFSCFVKLLFVKITNNLLSVLHDFNLPQLKLTFCMIDSVNKNNFVMISYLLLETVRFQVKVVYKYLFDLSAIMFVNETISCNLKRKINRI